MWNLYNKFYQASKVKQKTLNNNAKSKRNLKNKENGLKKPITMLKFSTVQQKKGLFK